MAFDGHHSRWRSVLEKYTRNGLVDYVALKKNPDDLNFYLDEIKGLAEAEYEIWSKNEKITFWINAYNALTIKIVTDHYPITRSGLKGFIFPDNSIQQIPNVWKREALFILGQDHSLDHIEHKILRRKFDDPRVHFALVCASLGCPALREEPFLADRFDEQLDDQTRRFLGDPDKNGYDQKSDTLSLSLIFRWFGEDFEKEGLIPLVKKYLPSGAALGVSTKTKILWLEYDWRLNEMLAVPASIQKNKELKS